MCRFKSECILKKISRREFCVEQDWDRNINSAATSPRLEEWGQKRSPPQVNASKMKRFHGILQIIFLSISGIYIAKSIKNKPFIISLQL
jgi:hypothetical protein